MITVYDEMKKNHSGFQEKKEEQSANAQQTALIKKRRGGYMAEDS